MADPILEPAQWQTNSPDALANIQSAPVDADLTPSDDETPEEKALQLETVQSALGVSIGQQQTRLVSPNTPAAEKAAALDDTDGGARFEGWQQSNDGTVEQIVSQPGEIDDQSDENVSQDPALPQDTESAPAKRSPRLPSPWRATPGKTRVDDRDHRTALRDAFTHSRRRALSGSSAAEALKKYINVNLPSLPKTPNLLNFSLPNFSTPSLDHAYGRTAPQRKRFAPMYIASADRPPIEYGSSVPNTTPDKFMDTAPLEILPGPRHATTDPIPQRQFTPQSSPSYNANTVLVEEDLRKRTAPKLRRSNSESSLLLYRQKSITPSLGDDSRFENVQGQVNSRLKAIKDSWQDATFKLPSLPTMSDFGFGSREDLFKSNRNTNALLKGVNAESSSSSTRASFLVNTGTASRGGSAKLLPRARTSSTAMSSSAAATHPYFTQALQDLSGDLVILGGYRGSILRSAEPPNRQLWVPIKVGLNLRKVDLEVGLNPEDEETEEERIIPGGMLTHIGPIDIAKRLFKRLRASDNARSGHLRVHDYGYDWRLSPHILSRRFIEYLKSLPCNQPGVPPEKRGAIVLAHSLGGLITRHAINQHPELVAGVIYAGVPQTCVNILGPLRNGDDVLLSSRVLTAQVNFTIRTSYALLPLDGKCFINKETKEEYPVDFFDVNTWAKYSLSPCIAPPLPHPNTAPNLRSASGLLNAMTQVLPSLPSRKPSASLGKSSTTYQNTTTASPATTLARAHPQGTQKDQEPHASAVDNAADVLRNAADKVAEGGAQTTGMTPQMNNQAHQPPEYAGGPSNPATTVTIPHDKAVAYLMRTLADVKKFKQELAHKPEHTACNAYPPIALIYGKSTPTVYGAKVESREAIKRADAYDELAFASGDGVVLARAAMVPDGYSVVRGGVVSSDRGHVTLLGDLEAVGRCLSAVVGARKNGVGLGEGALRGGERIGGKMQGGRDGVNRAE